MSIGTVGATVGFAVGSIFLLTAFTGCKKHTPQEKADYIVDKVSKKLDLQPDQRKELERLSASLLDIRQRNQANREKRIAEAKNIFLADKLDQNRVKEIYAEKKSEIDNEFPKVLAQFAAFHATLSPEQKKEAVELAEKFHKKRCKWKKH